MNVETMAAIVERLSACAADGFVLRPWLVGASGTGKTTLSRELAKFLSLPFLRVLPATGDESVAIGLPHREDGQTVILPPSWALRASREPHLILLDEMDKAVRSRERAAFLCSLLDEGRIGDAVLHPQTVIICAGQPIQRAVFLASEEGRALSGRACYIYVNEADAYRFVGRQHFHLVDPEWLSSWAESKSSNQYELAYPQARKVDYCLRVVRKFGLDDVTHLILSGSLGSDYADRLVQHIQSRPAWEHRSLLRAIAADPSRAFELTPVEAESLLYTGMIEGPSRAVGQLLIRIVLGADTDEDTCRRAISLWHDNNRRAVHQGNPWCGGAWDRNAEILVCIVETILCYYIGANGAPLTRDQWKPGIIWKAVSTSIPMNHPGRELLRKDPWWGESR